MNDVPLVAGVDAAKGGWVMAITGAAPGSQVTYSLFSSFADAWTEAQTRGLLAVGVDMPIGLPGKDLRRSDIEARELLGPRRSSLFWTPPHSTLEAADHAEANRLARRTADRGLSMQAFHLLPKVREVRSALSPGDLSPEARPRAAEVHPETSFAVLAGRPMAASKRQRSGISERVAALKPQFAGLAAALAPFPATVLNDLLDAAAAAWTARRIAAGASLRLGDAESDCDGYPMAILA